MPRVRPESAYDLEVVRPDQPDQAFARVQRAAADLRESSSERAEPAADLEAASSKERLD